MPALLPDLPRSFSQSYVEAREKFCTAASARHASIQTIEHPTARGRNGETLASDLALLGPPDAANLLLLSSGTHGVEGYCGSGVQTALLGDPAVTAAIDKGGVAVLLLHAINPYGFAHDRRVNEDNVDVNRNFRDFGKVATRNAGYAQVHELLVPATWPPDPENNAKVGSLIAAHGLDALQAVVSRGQTEFPDGVFYAGTQSVWSNRTLRAVLKRHALARQRLGWIDFHTGLGPAGHGEKIFAGPNDGGMLARVRSWYGNDVTSFYDGSSTSAEVEGALFHAALDECPNVELTCMALEYGTRPFHEVLTALRAEQWLANHPDTQTDKRDAIKREMRDAFYTDTDAWKGMVYGQARAAVFQALRGLA
jgi:Protein of unknown function (DUF2817)